VDYVGPREADLPAGPVRVVLFGPKTGQIARSSQTLAVLRTEALGGRQWMLLPVSSWCSLASDESAYCTDGAYTRDGGLTAV
jgi:hypothetical protein